LQVKVQAQTAMYACSSVFMSQESVQTYPVAEDVLHTDLPMTMASAPEQIVLRIRTIPGLYMQQSNTTIEVEVENVKQLLASFLWCGRVHYAMCTSLSTQSH